MRLAFLFFSLCLAGALATPTARATQFTAMLVTASKKPGPTDPRLAAYENTLKRILRFESFALVGEGQANIAAPGKGQLSLGAGHQLTLEIEGGGGRLRALATWLLGKRVLMNQELPLRPGVPAVLAGPGTGKDGEVYAVIVIAR